MVQVMQVDVFTTFKNKGNPAGVVDDFRTQTLDETMMQEVARKAGFSETVFIQKSQVADCRLRYFMPEKETPLCGHATIGAAYYLRKSGYFDDEMTIETQVGVLKVTYENEMFVMEQDRPRFIACHQSPELLCELVGIAVDDLDDNLPIMYGNTGSWTLLLPVIDESVLAKMKSDNARFPEVLEEVPASSIHPFCVVDQENHVFDGRHFAGAASGVIEDPVTGTAAGVMGAYLHEHLYPHEPNLELTILQGSYVNRPGTIHVQVAQDQDGPLVKVGGQAIINTQTNIELESQQK